VTRLEVLTLLRDLFDGACLSSTDPDDWSGCSTKYYVDQEEVLTRLDRLIEEETPSE
jgi:hypothetical protein